MEEFYYKSSVYVFVTDFKDKTKTLKQYIIDILDKISSTPGVVYTRVTAFVIDNPGSKLSKLLTADYKYPSDDLYRYLPEHEEAASDIVKKLQERSHRDYLINPVILLRILTNDYYDDTGHRLFTSSDEKVMFLVGDNSGMVSEIGVTNTYYYTVMFVKVTDDIITYDAGLANKSNIINTLMKFFREDNGDVDIVIFIKYI